MLKFIFILFLDFLILGCQKQGQINVGNVNPQTQTQSQSYKLDPIKGCYNKTYNSFNINSIVGGQKVLAENPINNHSVLIKTPNNDNTKAESCSGVLINKNTVLTAAHCFEKTTTQTFVYTTPDLLCASGFNREMIFPSSKVIIHPGYKFKKSPSRTENEYDIAIVEFKGDIPKNYAPISLESIDAQSLLNTNGDQILLAGYGRVNTANSAPEELRLITKTPKDLVVNQFISELKRSVNLITEFGVIGVNQKNGQGICFGDSGGPLVLATIEGFKLLGIASSIYFKNDSDKKCESSEYSYYTFIPPHLDWINQNLQQLQK